MTHFNSVENRQNKLVWIAKYYIDSPFSAKSCHIYVLKRTDHSFQVQLLTSSISSLRLYGHSAKERVEVENTNAPSPSLGRPRSTLSSWKQSAELGGWSLTEWGTG